MQKFINKKNESNFTPWLICLIGMLFYFYNFFLRVSPSVMQEDLTRTLKLTAYQFGHLSSFYYFGYTLTQLPAGILYDKFGVKFVQLSAVILSVLGLIIFIFANTYSEACLGRFLIGLGGSFAYIGVLKLASDWLPKDKFALATGFTTMFGMSAAILSDFYLTRAVRVAGYQRSLFVGLVMGIALSFIIIFFLKNKPKKSNENNNRLNNVDFIKALKLIILNKQMWLIGVISCLTYLPSSAFLDLWGITYLKIVWHFSAEQSANIISAAFMGWLIGAPFFGAFSDKIKCRLTPLFISYIFVLILFCYILYSQNFSFLELYICFFFIGFFCGSHILCFALSKENNEIYFSGISVAFCNCLTMLGGMITQPLVGKLLDYHHKFNLIEDAKNYTSADFIYALAIIPIGLILALCLSFFLKDTYVIGEKNCFLYKT